MTVYNFGSINIDHVYQVNTLPKAGETVFAESCMQVLGGKGANQSVAAARAGARVHHIGAVGQDGVKFLKDLQAAGVQTHHVSIAEQRTGSALIFVDSSGENSIIVSPASNCAITESALENSLSNASIGDVLLVQNETNMTIDATKLGKSKGMRVVYSAAPFDVGLLASVSPYIDYLLLNEVEANQLRMSDPELYSRVLSEMTCVVTRGGDGVWLFENGEKHEIAAYSAQVVDTSGAGDTFAGYLAALVDEDVPLLEAIDLAVVAAGLQVARLGTSSAIPLMEEVVTVKNQGLV